LSLLILASAAGSIAAAVGPSRGRQVSILTAIFLALSLVLMWILRVQGYEKIWFDCRAVAESVKTATWRYMMQAPPYDLDDESANLDIKFIKELMEIREARPGIDSHLAGFSSGATEISEYMRKTRVLPLNDRRKIYLQERLQDQKKWYDDKTGANQTYASVWFWSISAMQALALILSIMNAATGPWSINIVSIIMTLAIALVAWTQVKRHDELIQPYGLATQELTALESLECYVSEPKKFQEFVTQVEEAISREHTMWCARRNVLLETKRQ
jgi:ABC-type multidrug transport system fused ATPase/permease subunit